MAPLTRSMKKKAANSKSRIMQSLPKELLVEVLAKVASNSFNDLYSAKLSCKDFNKMAEEDYIFQCIDISKFPLVSWRFDDKFSKFLKHCKKCGNAEALYRQGLRDLFRGKRVQQGIMCLKKAASKGHVEATYVYGAILVCFGGESKQEGLKLLYSLNHYKPKGFSVRECREKVKGLVWNMWADRKVVGKIVQARHETAIAKTCSDCGNRQEIFTVERGWDPLDHENFSSCNTCRWHQEVNIFRDILNDSCTPLY
ncbi:PREDICTED: F-box [Prunus dulcis]|uniref:PREDICTED: F-box n=1 Tax=Prunus dulcis TaxID=3755 RepID=A0A5E4EM80_PRUDU|nr:putative F-box protein At1g67623 [Prunus dulcis]XP_034199960.1 putative F-box protein At1g67623 [Prunus dulcis]KAI5349524.1 hypothetical protein L3X38_002412 [Prunus dulcis]VVA16793.1 PREDICTED: F-box [Prunus dulcis]